MEDDAFDRVMQMVGDRGSFQKRFNYIFNVGLVIFVSMIYMNIILALSVPDHWCHVPGREFTNLTIDEWKNLTLPRKSDNRGIETHDSCKMYNFSYIEYFQTGTSNDTTLAATIQLTNETGCIHGYEYDKQWYERTTVTQEDWVCEKDLYVTNTFVLNRIGEVVGTFIFGQLGDTLGRRIVHYLSLTIVIFGRLLSLCTSSNFFLFSIAAIVGSLTSFFVFQSPLVIAMETNNASARGHIAMMQCIGWTVGLCIMPLVFWVVRDWVWFLLVTTVPSLIFLCLPQYMIESPRWLANRQRLKECAVELMKIAKINGKDVVITEKMLRDMLPNTEVEKVYGMMSLLTTWRLAKNSILLVIGWAICATTYMTIILNISKMGGNPFLNFLWQSATELPAFILGQKFCDTVGRRYTNSSAFLLSSLCCVAVVLVVKNTEMDAYATIFTVFVKFAISIDFFAINLQAMEIYPTCLRQTGISLGAIIGNIVGGFGPYIVFLGTNYDVRYPFMILGILCFFGFIAGFFLPETLHQKLPETLEDAQIFGADQSFFSMPKAPKKTNRESYLKTDDNNDMEAKEKLNQEEFQP